MKRSRTVVFVALALAFVLAGFSVADPKGLRRYMRLSAEADDYEQRAGVLRQQNDALRREIDALLHDSRALEQAAREDLGLVRANEVVFRFE